MSVWYILLAIPVIEALILIHELGHYICARICGVEIKEFSIGMGPKIFGWVSSKTQIRYCIKLLPIGGYVSMAGEDEDSDSENAFNKKSVWKRLLIVISGPIMNLVLGFILVVIMVSISGNLYSNVINYSDDISAISQESGLQSGDRIIKVGSTRVHTWSEVSDEVFNKGYKPIDITVIRGGEKIVVKNVVFPTLEESGVLFGQPDFSPSKDDYSYGNILKHSFYRSLSTVRLVVGSFIDLIKGRYGVDAVSGPIGISQTIGAFAQRGAYHFLFIVSLISINLGVFNLFPFPGLDGGRLLFLVIEAILGKPLNRNVEGYIHFVGIIILLGLALTVTFNDILRLFTK